MAITQAMPKTTQSPLGLLAYLEDYVRDLADCLPRADRSADQRSYDLLELSADLEVWAIHWPQGRRLELHDHGGSTGALVVVEGELDEHAIGFDGRLLRQRIAVGHGTAFGPDYVHDVVNPSAAPATSIHAYAPPMSSMTFYRSVGTSLVADRSEYRADPGWAP
ncbi:MAG TPA: cysteine dioxygenase family protein [Acidimicrobiales bacterium]